jgi:hypothetical protein
MLLHTVIGDVQHNREDAMIANVQPLPPKSRLAVLTFCLAASLTGCVTINQPESYRPQTYGMRQAYYKCYQEAQQGQMTAAGGYTYSNGQGSGAAGMRAGAVTNSDMLLGCMNAEGYDLRTPSNAERWTAILTSPIWFPLGLLGTLNGIKLGGGNGGP